MSELTDLSKLTVSANCSVISKKTCYDLDITPSGDILLAGNRSFDICNMSGEILRTVPTQEGDYTSIQCYKDKIYTLLKEPKGSNKRRVVVFDASSYKEVHRWELPDYAYVSMLAVSNDKVYVVDSDSQKVKIYSLAGHPKTDFHHVAFRNPVYMSSYSSDGVLLTDWAAGIVYKIDSETDKIAWQFNVNGARGVYCDKMGLVWVWSSKDKSIYVRSSDGKLAITIAYYSIRYRLKIVLKLLYYVIEKCIIIAYRNRLHVAEDAIAVHSIIYLRFALPSEEVVSGHHYIPNLHACQLTLRFLLIPL